MGFSSLFKPKESQLPPLELTKGKSQKSAIHEALLAQQNTNGPWFLLILVLLIVAFILKKLVFN